MSTGKIFSNIMVGLLFSILWILIGSILYIDYLYNIGMQFLPYFLWGIPFLAALFSVIFAKKRGYKISLITCFVGSILFTLMVPVLLE
ncbi:putative membrane protein YhfC [Paenibacillus castaneae]|uniref:hypothetical protein n=1 Tax=Paenibacillus castaneae TaxID=474957 RepID=UPI0011AF1273|nr:hypothetical protein [Paenibacillus castaneae]NIK76646.1 putative membrane protein YhfC [Paenibacillus castaneae]